jgi:hypothetical protein
MTKILVFLAAIAAFSAASAQTVAIPVPGLIKGTVGANGRVEDVPESRWLNPSDPSLAGSFIKKIYTVPAGVNFRLTDMTSTTRRANTTVGPCNFELWIGTDTVPTAFVYTLIKLYSESVWDRSWISGIQIPPGASLWMVVYTGAGPNSPGFPTNCVRADPSQPLAVRYGVRGYLYR